MREECYHKVVLIEWFDIIDKEVCVTKRASLNGLIQRCTQQIMQSLQSSRLMWTNPQLSQVFSWARLTSRQNAKSFHSRCICNQAPSDPRESIEEFPTFIDQWALSPTCRHRNIRHVTKQLWGEQTNMTKNSYECLGCCDPMNFRFFFLSGEDFQQPKSSSK